MKPRRYFERVGICLAAAGLLMCGPTLARGGTIDIALYGGFGTGGAIEGPLIENLTSAPAFPADPTLTSQRPETGVAPLSSGLQFPDPFEETDFAGDNYGSRARGFLEVPADGEYKFFIRADDGGQFELNSSGASQSGAEVVARVPGEDCCDAFVDDGIRSSEPIMLEKGTQYFFRVLHKEATGGDWWQVGWTGPGMPEPEVIGSPFVQRFVESGTAPTVTQQPTDTTVKENETAVLSAAVDASPPVSYQWMKNGEPVEGAVNSSIEVTGTVDGELTADYTLEISNSEGETTTDTVTVEIIPDETAPVASSARGSGDPHGIIVQFSEAVEQASATDTANYSFSGQDLTINGASLRPGETSVLLDVSQYTTDPLEVTVSGVKDQSSAANEMDEATLDVSFRTLLLAFWDFDTDSENVTVDNVRGAEAEFEGGAQIGSTGSGHSGESGDRALDVSGDGQMARVENASFLNALGERNQMTVSFWQNLDEIVNSSSFWMVSPSTGSGNRGAQAHVPWSNNNIFFDTAGCCGGDTRINAPISDFNDASSDFFMDWHHYAFVKDGDTKQIWIDGELFLEGTNPGPLPTDFTEMVIGGDGAGGNSLAGVLDEFAIFEAPLGSEALTGLAEGGNPGEFAEPIAGPLTITEQPSDQTVTELRSATFSIEASGTPPVGIGYQWFRNGEPMEGETASSLTLDEVALEDNGTTFSVDVFNVDGTFERLTSDQVTLTVTEDTTPPSVANAEAPDPSFQTVELTFSEEVTTDSAENTDNYSIEGISVNGATLMEDGQTVLLETSMQDEATEYTVTVNGVSDVSSNANTVSDGQATWFTWVTSTGGLSRRMYLHDGNFVEDDIYTPPPQRDDPSELPEGAQPFGTDPSQNSTVVRIFESPRDVADNYGVIMSGWLVPPETGEYTFYLSSDDNSQLWLSTDEDPANAEQIASEPQWNGFRNWTGTDRRNSGDPENISDPIQLEAGQRHYVEAVFNEGGGGDGMEVTWQKPGEEPPENGDPSIAGEFLMSTLPPQDKPSVVTQSPGEGATSVANDSTVTLKLQDGNTGRKPVDPDSVTVTINGNEVTADVTKEDGTTTVSFTPETPFDSLETQNVEVSFNFGEESQTIEWSFDTTLDVGNKFVEGTRFIEHEDYNYEEGQWIEGANGGPTGEPYDGGAYEGLKGVNGVDFNDDGGGGPEADDLNPYRWDDADAGDVPGPATVDFNSPEIKRDRGSFLVENNWKVGWTSEGEWYNYTRDFPEEEQTYEVFAHISSGGSDPMATLQRVTSDPTQEDQATEDLGQFSGPASGDWGTAIFYRMHEVGNPDNRETVTLSGVNTLRWLRGSGDQDINYMAFVPAEAPPMKGPELSISLSEGTITVTWDAAEAELQTATSVEGPWETSDQSSPATFSIEEAAQLFMRTAQ